jgi:hypothetical protein
MTTPYLRTRALVLTKEFLQHLASLEVPVVPPSVSANADLLLRHYPTLTEIETAHKANPEIFGPVPPFDRYTPNPEILGILDAASQARERE